MKLPTECSNTSNWSSWFFESRWTLEKVLGKKAIRTDDHYSAITAADQDDYRWGSHFKKAKVNEKCVRVQNVDNSEDPSAGPQGSIIGQQSSVR